jgi:hypothetical protein
MGGKRLRFVDKIKPSPGGEGKKRKNGNIDKTIIGFV